MTERITAVCAILASLLCGGAGAWILANVGLQFREQVLTVGIGLYLLGKGFAVGPMLWCMRRLGRQTGCALDRNADA